MNSHLLTLVMLADNVMGVLAASDLGFALEQGKLCFPKPRWPERNDKALSFVFVSDEAFPLKEYLIKSYPRISFNTLQRTTSYRISRARNLVVNVFWYLCQTIHIFQEADNSNNGSCRSRNKSFLWFYRIF